jgi:hypothetical protein
VAALTNTPAEVIAVDGKTSRRLYPAVEPPRKLRVAPSQLAREKSPLPKFPGMTGKFARRFRGHFSK